MCKCFFLIPVIILIMWMSWWFTPTPVQDNPCTIFDLVEDPSAIDKAIMRMGPHKQYIITIKGHLLVKHNGKWLRLHYKGES